MSRQNLAWLIVLIVAVLLSGVGVVYAKAQSRALFVESQKLRGLHDSAMAEWGRLQLELASQGGFEVVRRKAESRLSMRAPTPEEVVVVD